MAPARAARKEAYLGLDNIERRRITSRNSPVGGFVEQLYHTVLDTLPQVAAFRRKFLEDARIPRWHLDSWLALYKIAGVPARATTIEVVTPVGWMAIFAGESIEFGLGV